MKITQEKFISPGDVVGGFVPPSKDEPNPDCIGMMYIQATTETWEAVLAIANQQDDRRGLVGVRLTRPEAEEAIRRLQKLLRDANH